MTEQPTDHLREFVVSLPKAELHLHIEGTLEPELMLALAERNRIDPPFPTVALAKAAYDFGNLDDFLRLYYAATDVLRTAADFEDLTWAYLRRAHADGVVHVEPFFDPQSHLCRGVEMSAIVDGIVTGLRRGEAELGISWRLIMCFLRHLSEAEAFETLTAAEPYLDVIHGVGLDSSEANNPPSKFAAVFAAARGLGLRAVAHAGEEGPAEYIWEALDLLLVERIDHGIRAIDDRALMKQLAERRIPLNLCPLSNQRLQVVPDLTAYPARQFIEAGVPITISSDDPAYFGGYIADNYLAAAAANGLSRDELAAIAADSLTASWR